MAGKGKRALVRNLDLNVGCERPQVQDWGRAETRVMVWEGLLAYAVLIFFPPG